jgi:hypothetical protein
MQNSIMMKKLRSWRSKKQIFWRKETSLRENLQLKTKEKV